MQVVDKRTVITHPTGHYIGSFPPGSKVQITYDGPVYTVIMEDGFPKLLSDSSHVVETPNTACLNTPEEFAAFRKGQARFKLKELDTGEFFMYGGKLYCKYSEGACFETDGTLTRIAGGQIVERVKVSYLVENANG